MVIKLKQIPKLLGIVKKFEEDKKAKPLINYISKTFNNSPVEEAVYPDFNEIGNFCKDAEILKFEEDKIYLSSLGNKILEEYKKDFSLNSEIKKIFREECFLSGNLSISINESLSRFVKNTNEIWAPSNQVFDLFPEKNILSLLYECELLLLLGDKVILNSDYFEKIASKKEKQVRISQKQIDAQLRSMKKTGDIAENFVVEYEKIRLKKLGFEAESNKVHRISIVYANAGYDVISFDGNLKDNEYDRFIEVKGSSGRDFNFHWSENEIKIATELKEKYWLYFVSEINLDKKTYAKLETIQDPISKIFLNDEFDKEIEGYHIRKKTITSN